MDKYNSGRRPNIAPGKSETTFDKTYFHSVGIFKYIAVVIGMAMLCFLAFHPAPESFLSKLGGPGQRLLYLRTNYRTQLKFGFFVAVCLHIGEAWYAAKLATDMNLTEETVKKWVIQTAILGYVSLQQLIKYKEEISKTK